MILISFNTFYGMIVFKRTTIFEVSQFYKARIQNCTAILQFKLVVNVVMLVLSVCKKTRTDCLGPDLLPQDWSFSYNCLSNKERPTSTGRQSKGHSLTVKAKSFLMREAKGQLQSDMQLGFVKKMSVTRPPLT